MEQIPSPINEIGMKNQEVKINPVPIKIIACLLLVYCGYSIGVKFLFFAFGLFFGFSISAMGGGIADLYKDMAKDVPLFGLLIVVSITRLIIDSCLFIGSLGLLKLKNWGRKLVSVSLILSVTVQIIYNIVILFKMNQSMFSMIAVFFNIFLALVISLFLYFFINKQKYRQLFL